MSVELERSFAVLLVASLLLYNPRVETLHCTQLLLRVFKRTGMKSLVHAVHVHTYLCLAEKNILQETTKLLANRI